MGKRKGLLPLYEAFAVPPDYAGPLADDFHKMVARKYIKGMRGGHSSVVDGAKVEDLVREHLGLDWALSRGLYRGMNRFDSKFNWRKGKHWQDEISKVRMWLARCRWHFTPNPYRVTPPVGRRPC